MSSSYEMVVTIVVTPSKEVSAEALQKFAETMLSTPTIIKTGDGNQLHIIATNVTAPVQMHQN